MTSRVLSLFSLALFALLAFSFTINGWDLKKDKNGVKVYTKSVDGYKLKAYKATMKINATPEAVLEKLLDVKSYPDWQHNCKTGRITKKISNDKFYAYTVTDAPWPVSDRDVLVLYEVVRGKGGSITLKMNAKDGITPKVNGNVRISYMKGYWKIIPLGNGQVEVIQEAHANPGGSIPDWLANSAVVDTPYESMLKFKSLF